MNDFRWIEIRDSPQAERDEIRELGQTDHDHHFQNVLIAKTVRAQNINVCRPHLSWMVVQFDRNVEEGLIAGGNIADGVVERNLLRLGTFNTKHPNDLAMR